MKKDDLENTEIMGMTLNEEAECLEVERDNEVETDALELAPALEMIAVNDPVMQQKMVEAILFASPEPVSLEALRNKLPETADLGAIILSLQEFYASRGVVLQDIGGRYAFRTAPEMASILQSHRHDEKRLSRAALETLAIISYHQPLTRAEIENIRGVATNKGTLDALMEAGWIKPGKRREAPGRPVTWVTTPMFMDHFGLADLNDLPGMEELKASGLLDRRPAIESVSMPSLFGDDEGDALSEGASTLASASDSENDLNNEEDFDDESRAA